MTRSLSLVAAAFLLLGASHARAEEAPRTRAIDARLGLALAGNVSFEGADEGVDSLRLDLAYLWRRTHASFGPVATVWRWDNASTSVQGGGAATLVGVGGILDLHGAGRSGPYGCLGLGLAISSVSAEFSLPYQEDRTVAMESTTGAGVLYEASAGWRFALGATTYLTAAIGLRGAGVYHRAETFDGRPGNGTGSLSEKSMSLFAVDASLGLGFQL